MILPLLQILNSAGATRRQRNAAAAQLQQELEQRGWPLCRMSPGRTLSDDDLSDIIQHVLFQAIVGTARCEATTEAGAWAWCKQVAYHFALDLKKRRSHHDPLEGTALGETLAAPSVDPDQGLREEARQMLHHAQTASQQSIRGDDKQISVNCAVEYVFEDASIDEQIAHWAFFPHAPPAELTADDRRRAGNRVYAYRSRGVIYLTRALDQLEQEGALTPTDTEFLRKILLQKKRSSSVRQRP